MSKQLTLDEMLIAASNSNMPGLDRYVEHLEALALDLGGDLARHLDIEGPVECSLTAEEGGGIMGGFAPKFTGQPIPDVLKEFDTLADWEVREKRREAEGS